MAPITCARLWSLLKAAPEKVAHESTFVVRMSSAMVLDTPQPCFSFVHPAPPGRPDNSRFCSLAFEAQCDAMVHGFAGYFEAVLAEGVLMSTNPATASRGMFSWFPLYIPLTCPVRVRRGDAVEAHFWRCVSPSKVWYQWCVTSPSRSHVHNAGGSAQSIGLH